MPTNKAKAAPNQSEQRQASNQIAILELKLFRDRLHVKMQNKHTDRLLKCVLPYPVLPWPKTCSRLSPQLCAPAGLSPKERGTSGIGTILRYIILRTQTTHMACREGQSLRGARDSILLRTTATILLLYEVENMHMSRFSYPSAS